MTNNEHAPKSLRLVHGMEHAGLSGLALEIEQRREFKRSFEATISREPGFDGVESELLTGRDPAPHLAAFLDTFGPEGYPMEAATTSFLSAEIASRAGEAYSVGEETLALCIPTPTGWIVVGGYGLLEDEEPRTSDAAVGEYERRHGKISDPVVRAELAGIPVHVQIEWEIRL